MTETTETPETPAATAKPAVPPPSAPQKAPLMTNQTRPLWIAILVLAATLLSIVAFWAGRASADFGDRFGDRGPGGPFGGQHGPMMPGR